MNAAGFGPERPSGERPDGVSGVDSVRRNQVPNRALDGGGRDVRDYWNRREPAVGILAARQHTLITHEQLVALGLGSGAIHSALRRKRLYPRHRGVYSVVAPPALPPLAREHAAVLACGSDTFLSHHTAAAVWGIRRAQTAGAAVDVTVVGRDAGRRRSGVRARRTGVLDRRDTRSRESIPIVSAARALLDIAPDLSERDIERAFDEALVLRLISLGGVQAMVRRYPGRPGSAILLELATPDRHTTATRSEAEERLLTLMRRAGLPSPEVGVKLGNYTADFFWRRERVVVEVDGYRFHRGRFAFERDHRRDAEHQAAGILVIRVTWRQLEREPELFLVRLATALALRREAS